jgi:6-phosphogluconolactonase
MPADLVLPTAEALAEAAAELCVASANEAIKTRGRFVIALAGGQTPRATYRRLATKPLASRVMWTKVQVVWGDERCVPPDHPESNYRMAREALLDQVPLLAANVHRIHGEDDPAAAALDYEATLRELLRTPIGEARAIPGARIDLVLLGLGSDGHTASLLPGSAAARERTRWVVADHFGAGLPARITLTKMVINAAAEILFLVSGSTKAGITQRVLEGPRSPDELPAQTIAPSNGRVRWWVDQAAAVELGKS